MSVLFFLYKFRIQFVFGRFYLELSNFMINSMTLGDHKIG